MFIIVAPGAKNPRPIETGTATYYSLIVMDYRKQQRLAVDPKFPFCNAIANIYFLSPPRVGSPTNKVPISRMHSLNCCHHYINYPFRSRRSPKAHLAKNLPLNVSKQKKKNTFRKRVHPSLQFVSGPDILPDFASLERAKM